MNLPNILTGIRFILIPIFGYYLYREQYTTAVVLFLLGGITDVLDGYIARKYNLITSWGKLADPLADKLMQITALILLTIQHKIPVLILVIITTKELLMGLGSILIYRNKKYVVSANWYGKMATVIFYFAVAAIIIFDLNSLYNNIFIGIAVLCTLFAFFMYLLSYIRINK
ncbi:MAG: CDP-alcohol phosphatidyltransferase family protein [Acetivibrionales bacterium]